MKITDIILFITNKANDAILLERIDDKNTNSPISRLPELHDVPDEKSQIEDFIKDTMQKDTGIDMTVNVISNKTTRTGSDTNESVRFAICTAEMNNARIWTHLKSDPTKAVIWANMALALRITQLAPYKTDLFTRFAVNAWAENPNSMEMLSETMLW